MNEFSIIILQFCITKSYKKIQELWHKLATIPDLLHPYLPVVPKIGVARAWILGETVLLLT